MVRLQQKTFQAETADELVYAEIKCPHYGNEYPMADCVKRVQSAKKRKRQGLKHSMESCINCNPQSLPIINMRSEYVTAKGEGVKRCHLCGVVKSGAGPRCQVCANQATWEKRIAERGFPAVRAVKSVCITCGGKLGRDNTSGRCRTCANQARKGNRI